MPTHATTSLVTDKLYNDKYDICTVSYLNKIQFTN